MGEISTSVGAQNVRNYHLSYTPTPSAATGRSLLASVQISDANDAHQSIPTTFGWDSQEFVVNTGLQQSYPFAPLLFGGLTANGLVFGSSTPGGVFQDLNSDGVADYSAATLYDDGTHDYHIYLGIRGGGFQTTPSPVDLPGPLFYTHRGPSTLGSPVPRSVAVGQLADFNGDGIADYVRGSCFMDTTPAGLTACDAQIYYGSVPSSGALGYTRSNESLEGPTALVWSGDFKQVPVGVVTDFNGDGLADYAYVACDSAAVPGTCAPPVWLHAASNGTFSFGTVPSFTLPYPLYTTYGGTEDYIPEAVLQDINGDGLPDLAAGTCMSADGVSCLPGSPAWTFPIYIGSGSGFTRSSATLPGPLAFYNYTSTGQFTQVGVLQDLNGDGTADYSPAWCQSPTDSPNGPNCHLSISYFDGTSFVPALSPSSTVISLPGPMFYVQPGQWMSTPTGLLQDLDGDGMPEYSPASCQPQYFSSSANFTPAGRQANCQLGVYHGPLFNTELSTPLPGPKYMAGCGAVALYVDVTGDGITDYLSQPVTYTNIPLVPSSQLMNLGATVSVAPGSAFVDRVSNIVREPSGANGVAVTYSTLNDPGVYSAGSTAVYPERTIGGGGAVVVKTSAETSGGKGRGMLYSYQRARFDVSHGWLGFYMIERDQYPLTPTEGRSLLGSTDQYWYRNTFPGPSLLVRHVSRMGVALIDITDTTYGPQFPTGNGVGVNAQSVFLPRTAVVFTALNQGVAPVSPTPSVPNALDPASGYAPAESDIATTHRTDYENDGYGNALSETESDINHVKRTCRTYSYAASTPAGLLTAEKVLDGNGAACDAGVWNTAWDSVNDLGWERIQVDSAQRPIVVQRYDSSAGAWVQTQYTYDAWGNVAVSVDESGSDTLFQYDPTYHFFLARRESPPVPAGGRLVTQMVVEPFFGNAVYTVDPSGAVSAKALDGFGLTVAEYASPPAGGNEVIVKTHTIQPVCSPYAGAAPALCQTDRARKTWTNDDNPTVWQSAVTYDDGYGNARRTESAGPNGLSRRGVERVLDVYERPLFESNPFVAQPGVQGPSASAASCVGNAMGTTYCYDPMAVRPSMRIGADGSTQAISYPSSAMLPEVTITTPADSGEPASASSVFYTARGEEVFRILPNGANATFITDALGRSKTTVDPRGLQSQKTYDSLGRVTTAVDPDRGTTALAYFDDGRLSKEKDAAGNVVWLERDRLGRVVGRTTLNGAGGEDGSADLYYDGPSGALGFERGRLIRAMTNPGVTSPSSSKATFAHDAAGNVTTHGVSPYNGRVYYEWSTYGPDGTLERRVYPDGAQLIPTYTPDGLPQALVEYEANGTKTQYAAFTGYDAWNHVGAVALGNGVTTQYQYRTDLGLLQHIQAGPAAAGATPLLSKTYGYDARQSVIAVTDTIARAQSETFTYDPMGYMIGATGAFGTKAYTYDPAGDLLTKDGETFTYNPGSHQVASSDQGLAITYLANGNRATKTKGGVIWGYSYDAEGNLVTATQGGQTILSNTYDAFGNLLTKVDQDGATTVYLFPDYEELTTASASGVYTKYVDGPTGRIAAISTSTVQFVTAPPAAPAAPGALTLSDPPSGSGRGFRATNTLSFDGLDARTALVFAALSALIAWALASIGGRSRRRGRRSIHPVFTAVNPLVLAAFLAATLGGCAQGGASPPGEEVAEQTASALLNAGSSGAGRPIPGVQYFVSDRLSSTSLVLDASGAVLSNVHYMPFGEIDQTSSSGADTFRAKFAGTEWETQTQLYAMGSRHYDPEVGQFTTPDPKGQFFNPYLYSNNNPATYSDPSGEFVVLALIVLAVVVGAYLGGVATNGNNPNPAQWNWSSGRTWGGILIGGTVGGLTSGIGLTADCAVVGIGATAFLGAGENAAYAALNGGSAEDVVTAWATGLGVGLATGYLGEMGGDALANARWLRSMAAVNESASEVEAAQEGVRAANAAAPNERISPALWHATTPRQIRAAATLAAAKRALYPAMEEEGVATERVAWRTARGRISGEEPFRATLSEHGPDGDLTSWGLTKTFSKQIAIDAARIGWTGWGDSDAHGYVQTIHMSM